MLNKLSSATTHLLRSAVSSSQIERDELDDPWQVCECGQREGTVVVGEADAFHFFLFFKWERERES
jgi:hypothetical protein